jgi:hypothetical protein
MAVRGEDKLFIGCLVIYNELSVNPSELMVPGTTYRSLGLVHLKTLKVTIPYLAKSIIVVSANMREHQDQQVEAQKVSF